MHQPTVNRHKSKSGLGRIWNAFGYSLAGLRAAFAHEHAFRQEVAMAVVLIPAALLVEISMQSKAILIGSVLFVLVVELLNSAIEATVDLISLDDNPLAKRAKDIGSAAVFFSLLNLGVVWLMVLL